MNELAAALLVLAWMAIPAYLDYKACPPIAKLTRP